MDFQLLFICGIVAGVLSVFAYLPYIADTLKGQTRPQRSTWMIWSILSSMSFFSQLAEGATDSLWFSGVQASGTIIVSLLSIRFGTGNFLNRADSFILMGAAFGLCLWYVTDTAVYALAISIGISALGGVLTVTKAYRDPGSESMVAWLVSFTATIFAIASIGKVDAVLLAYPVYLFVLYGVIIIAILLGRAEQSFKLVIGTQPGSEKCSVSHSSPVSVSEPSLAQPVVFRTLVRNSGSQQVRNGLAAVKDDKMAALIAGLKKRGVGEHVIEDALYDAVQG